MTRLRTARRALTLPACLCSALAGLGLPAAAQTAPDGLWHGDISIGGSLASGNSETTTFNLRAAGTRETEAGKLALSALVNHGRSKADGVTTRSADLARLNGRHDRQLGRRYFAFAGGEAETNRTAGVSSRLSANAGAGWHVLRADTVSWNLFTGIGHAGTRFTDGSKRQGVEWLLGEESSHKLGESSSISQRLVLYPGSSDIGNRATFDASLVTAIVGGWTFNTSVSLRHTSKVPAGTRKNERLLGFGFGYKF